MSADSIGGAAFGPRPVLSATGEAVGLLERSTALRPSGVGELWNLSEGELAEAFAGLDRLRAIAESLQVAVLTEVRGRGLGVGSGLAPVDWALRAAPGLEPADAALLDRVAAAGSDARLGQVSAAVAVGSGQPGGMSVRRAGVLLRFHGEVERLADPKALASVLSALVDAAAGPDGSSARDLGKATRYAGQLVKPARDLESEESRQRAARSLVKTVGPCGMSAYRLLLDPEGSAILDAALDPLSRPQPEAEGEPDHRSASTRRADALLTVIGRGVASPGEGPSNAKSTLVVTMTLSALIEGIRSTGLTGPDGTGLGSGPGSEVLSPGMVRRLACEADVIPMVLGTDSEVLDVGRRKRLVPPPIRMAAWRRDRHCTWPGCSVPVQWCDAHHGIPWWAGGETSLANTAMVCQRHHTLVHRRDHRPVITATGVSWPTVDVWRVGRGRPPKQIAWPDGVGPPDPGSAEP